MEGYGKKGSANVVIRHLQNLFVFYGSYDLFQQCFHGLHTINVCDCVRVVQENNILNILFCDKLVKAAFEFRIFGKIPVIHNINMLIMIHQEWNKGVAVGFLHNSTGRAIIKGWVVNIGKWFIAGNKGTVF